MANTQVMLTQSRPTAISFAAGVTSILIALLFSFPTNAQAQLAGTASAIDGDTIEVHGTRIQLHGIDAPESRQECQRPNCTTWRCGQQAALALSDHIGKRPVTCKPFDRDRYGRVGATCSLSNGELNRWMVANGWACLVLALFPGLCR
jgi:endonuclease YncB( thermonuclease family)